ncbi:UTP--glucose-1-phosphate uridylyltransferase [Spirochaetia bacterium 38H-sp]|uniref:UTP--glucose-1-phosphate uridylyltransferase n=1 Tax=Rarispira pelagica TaxID=3141764 RepID=A0ABU9UCG4_9SPIR
MRKLSPQLVSRMRELDIDVELSLKILDRVNKQPNALTETEFSLPTGKEDYIVDTREDVRLSLSSSYFFSRLKELGLTVPAVADFYTGGNTVELDEKKLKIIGILLYPKLAYGILNGGAATSYADSKKNSGFDKALFSAYESYFKKASELVKGRPKGVCPAYYGKSGEPGLSFMALKMRSLLIETLRYRSLAKRLGVEQQRECLPLFQMTSPVTHESVLAHIKELETHPAIEPLMQKLGLLSLSVYTAKQPLIAAFTHTADGSPLDIFTSAYGRECEPLALPGGHGQNFMVLADIYRQLYRNGYRFVYLTNVDNLGSAVDPVSLALLALSSKQAGFEFSYKTSVDVKGGVLVATPSGPLCMDIGAGISRSCVENEEKRGVPVLFNCATGLFDLSFLTANLDRIIGNLPLRLTDQDKDAGRYSQAEQITWEVMGLLDDILIFAVDKYRRFLAAKLLIETFLTSGLLLDDASSLYGVNPDVVKTADNLNRGLMAAFSDYYAIKPEDFSLLSADDIEKRLEETFDA